MYPPSLRQPQAVWGSPACSGIHQVQVAGLRGVFENPDNTAAPADTKTAPAVQHTRFAERNATLKGKARVIDVEAQLNR